MADFETVTSDPSQWELDHSFEDTAGNRITCGRTDCTVGSYALKRAGSSVSYGPACKTCEFTGDLGDVFNPEEPRYEPGAPESFKRAAALVLTQKDNSSAYSTLNVMRHGRPDTVDMIEAEATRAQAEAS